MAKISIETIQQALEPEGWQLVSTEYKNLDTQLEYKCSEGHSVYAPWKKMRVKLECPVCAQNKFKNQNTNATAKAKDVMRTFALDQASHKTGWSVFDDGKLVTFGVFEVTDGDEIERFHKVKEWFMSMVAAWKPDIIGIEGIQYQETFGVVTFQTLARLQGILMDTCYGMGLRYVICPTNTWRNHCGVKGRARADRKKSMQMLVKSWYDVTVTDDESDAIGIGKYVADTHKKPKMIVWE